jgi:hypothetical protein
MKVLVSEYIKDSQNSKVRHKNSPQTTREPNSATGDKMVFTP